MRRIAGYGNVKDEPIDHYCPENLVRRNKVIRTMRSDYVQPKGTLKGTEGYFSLGGGLIESQAKLSWLQVV